MHSQHQSIGSESTSKIKKDLKDYLVGEINSQTRAEFIKMFLAAPISLRKKVKYIEEIITQHNFNKHMCLEIINRLVTCCETVDDLLDYVIPLHKDVFASLGNHYRGFCDQLLVNIGIMFFNENLTPSNFSRILAVKPTNKVMLLELGQIAALNSFFAHHLFMFLDGAVPNQHFKDSDSIVSILKIYFEDFLRGYQSWEVSKTPTVISTIHHLLRKKTDPKQLFDLLLIRPGIIENWANYVDLLIDFAEYGIDRNIIINLLNVELGQKKLISIYQKTPQYEGLSPKDFGHIFYQLAKNGVLPKLKYNQKMSEYVFTAIISLPNQEEQHSVLKAIEDHDATQLNTFFWEKPTLTLFYGEQSILPKIWKKKINAALDTLEQEKTQRKAPEALVRDPSY